MKRLFNYAHVPGNHLDWKHLRELKLCEVILFLDLLGFQKDHDQWWSIPEGLPILDHRIRYQSLSDLGNALIRVPDLEDRGTCHHRQARKGEKILNDVQMVALRLRIAEGLENEDSYDGESAKKVDAEGLENEDGHDEESTMTEEAVMQLFVYDVCSHTDAWIYLKNLGCSYKNNRYFLPGNSKNSTIECQNDLVLYILVHSVNVLDWEHSTLKPLQVKRFERYLKGFNARIFLSDVSLFGQAYKEINTTNISNILEKIGISRSKNNGKYYIGIEEYNESSIVNMIRSTDDMYNLRNQNNKLLTSPSKRLRPGDPTLSTLERAVLRLWAVQSDNPLTNIPDDDLSTIIGR
jgi:hypothetical protein